MQKSLTLCFDRPFNQCNNWSSKQRKVLYIVIALRSNLNGVSKSNSDPLLAETIVTDRNFGIPLFAKNILKSKIN